MDRSRPYTQVMSNFDSAYNTTPNIIHRPPTMYMPISTSSSFSSHGHRSISPSLRSSNPKFNLDLYKPNEYQLESIDYPSPSSSVIIHHHHPVHSHSHSPPPSQAISKLRQINDELCHTLAHCELANQSQPLPLPLPSPTHHYIHHYPASDKPYRSRSSSERDSSSSSSTESEPVTKKHNARLTYKARIPRRQNSLSDLDQLLISTSDAYSNGDPMTVDVYPTRDQGFTKRVRNRPDNQSPWLADTSPIRRNSFSEGSTYRTPRTPRAPNYDDKLLQPKSRLARSRSTSVKSRNRPHQSAVSFSCTVPTWRPNGSIQRPKFIGSNAPPTQPKPPPREPIWNPAGTDKRRKEFRALDPVNKPAPPKISEPVWRPPSKRLAEKSTRYFEPAIKPELMAPIRTETYIPRPKKNSVASANPYLKTRIANAESKVKSAWNTPTTDIPLTTKPKKNSIVNANPYLKTRVANAESKVKSAWTDPTTTTNVKESKPPVPRLMKSAPTTIPPKTKVKSAPSKPLVPVKKVPPAPLIGTDTGRSSLNDVPAKPLFQSTPMNQSVVDENDDNVDDLFENESQASERPKKQIIPHPPPRIEKTPPKFPNKTVPEPDKGTKSTVKDGILVHGDDSENIREDNQTPKPLSETNNNNEGDQSEGPSPIIPARKAQSPKPDNRDDASVVDDEEADLDNKDATDADVEQSFGNDKSLEEAPKPKKDNVTPPPRRGEPPSRSPVPISHQSPVISKENDQQQPSNPPPATAANDLDDFFD